MFEKQEFVKGVYKLTEAPKVELPSLVICGRSNVGKSSFINSLFNRKNLAKTSSTPGKTRSLNFYLIDDRFYIIDLPGIGYAKTNKTESDFLGRLITDFFSYYENISHVFHLIDSRHSPTKMDLLLDELINENNLPLSLILTKADKLKQSELSRSKSNIISLYPDKKMNDSLFFYSSVDKTGKKEIIKKISSLFYTK